MFIWASPIGAIFGKSRAHSVQFTLMKFEGINKIYRVVKIILNEGIIRKGSRNSRKYLNCCHVYDLTVHM